jgi:cyanoexosortase B-associated protein
MKSVPLPNFMQRFQFPKVVVLAFLLVLLAVGAIPGYLTGHWSWSQPIKVSNLDQLHHLRQTGITIPGWQTTKQEAITFGGHQWLLQQLQQDAQKPAIQLLIFPQKGDQDQPQVEWMDIDGLMDWQTDSLTQLPFKVEPNLVQEAGGLPGTLPKAVNVEARFFRGWTQPPKLAQTFAVLQWYAWSDGGNSSPSRWFWADQLAQLRQRRVSWVAVSLQIPIEPLGNIELSRPVIMTLGQKIQAALMANTLLDVAE